MNTNLSEIRFQFQFNLQKLLGLPIDDNDIARIAAILDCDADTLKAVDVEFKQSVRDMAKAIRKQYAKKAKALSATPKKVICIGDSITSDRKSYQKILQEAFSETKNVSFIDAAISGDTTKNLMERLYSAILNQKFNTATIFIGTNDSRMMHDESYLPHTGLTDYENKLKHIIRCLKKKKTDVFIITLPYVDLQRLRAAFADRNYFYSPQHIDCMNALIRKIAGEMSVGLIDLSAELKNHGDVLEPDGIHLNSKAQMVLAGMVLRALG